MQHMKKSLLALVICSLLSCTEELSTTPGDPQQPVVQFSIGNLYEFYYQDFDGVAVYSGAERKEIVADTIIQNETFYVFNSLEILRSSNRAVFIWIGGVEIEWYRFDVATGDTVSFMGRQVVVTSVRQEPVFNESRRVIRVSDAAFSPETTRTARYSFKFGLLHTQTYYPIGDSWTDLTGAQLDSTKYGNMR